MDPRDICVDWIWSTVSWQFLSSQTKSQREKAIEYEIRQRWIARIVACKQIAMMSQNHGTSDAPVK